MGSYCGSSSVHESARTPKSWEPAADRRVAEALKDQTDPGPAWAGPDRVGVTASAFGRNGRNCRIPRRCGRQTQILFDSLLKILRRRGRGVLFLEVFVDLLLY